jgi:hypothetical protein
MFRNFIKGQVFDKIYQDEWIIQPVALLQENNSLYDMPASSES